MTALTTTEVDRSAAITAAERAVRVDDAFQDRVDEHFPRLHELFARLYGAHPDGRDHLTRLIAQAATSWHHRPVELRVSDGMRRENPSWLTSERMLGGVCYADRYAGNLAGVADQIPTFRELGLTLLHLQPLFATPDDHNDDAHTVSSYRRVNPSVGSMSRLVGLASDLHLAGISLMLDFALGHTASDHEWAQQAAAGDAVFAAYFATLDDRRGTLDYANPAVFVAMAGEALYLANQGVDVLRLDAADLADGYAASLPRTQLVRDALATVMAIAAPGVVFASAPPLPGAAHTDSPGACALSYDPVQMTLTWEALATGDARPLQHSLEHRDTPPADAARITYVRDHDALAWVFDDADTGDESARRRLLTDFYLGSAPGSFARGLPFPDPRTGDTQVSGTAASLAGIEAGDAAGVDRVVLAHAIAMSTGGLPMICLGDEVAQLNDPTFLDDPARHDDSRWVHRGQRPRDRYVQRADPRSDPGRVFTRLRQLSAARQYAPEFAGAELLGIRVPVASVLGFRRPGREGHGVLVLANAGADEVTLGADLFAGLPRDAYDLVQAQQVDLRGGLTLPALGFRWLRLVEQ
ncbi:alpha-amylase family glycosyl hydrolase [Microbacterium sp.]|uniref:alpha-amylase family glycosyl hydrolase n=1 Tax=Microbacterium sp. TaxID=51671 RepID=UPI003A8A737C